MDNELLSKRQLLIVLVFVVFAFIFFGIQFIFPKKAKFVVCDVGQGDGMYLRTREGVNIIIDAGPGPQIMECLGHEMSFFDKTIDIAFLTNPQKDHYGGFNYMFGHYVIKQFIGSPLAYNSPDFRALEQRLLKKKISLSALYRGSIVRLGKSAKITFLWPTEAYIQDHTLVNPKPSSVLSQYLGNLDPNKMSQVFFFQDGAFEVLFTGDAEQTALTEIMADKSAHRIISLDDRQNNGTCLTDECPLSSGQIEVLKIPHHGSKNGLIPSFYELADTMVSVISAGRKNRYGHPSPQTVSLLQASKRPYFLTARDGAIEIEYDARNFKIRNYGRTLFK